MIEIIIGLLINCASPIIVSFIVNFIFYKKLRNYQWVGLMLCLGISVAITFWIINPLYESETLFVKVQKFFSGGQESQMIFYFWVAPFAVSSIIFTSIFYLLKKKT